MASKSSDLDLTDLMETYNGSRKRKAETPNSDDSDGSEKNSTDETEGDGGEEDDDDDDDEYSEEENDFVRKNAAYSDTESEWGYDSFDEYEYNPSDQRTDPNEEVDELEIQQWRHYQCQLIETKGFFKVTDKFPRRIIGGIASFRDLDEPTILGITGRQLCEQLTCLCLERYKEKNVKLDHIVRVNWSAGSMSKFYITFAARESESPDAPLVEYQAKAAYTVTRKAYPILCRPSPAPKKVHLKLQTHITYVSTCTEYIKKCDICSFLNTK